MANRIKIEVLEKDKLAQLRNLMLVSWVVYFISSLLVVVLLNQSRWMILAVALFGIAGAISSAIFLYKIVNRLYINTYKILFFALYVVSMFIPLGWIISVVILTLAIIDIKKTLKTS